MISEEALRRGYVEPGEVCEAGAGVPVPVASVVALFDDPDTIVQAVTTNGVDVTAIATTSRHIPKAIRDALESRDRCCVVPGCGRTKNLEIDHIRPFATGGPTALTNLCRVCAIHHRLKSLGRYVIRRDDDGTWRYEPVARVSSRGSALDQRELVDSG